MCVDVCKCEYAHDVVVVLQAYQILQAGLDDPSQFMNLFTQLEADPFRQQHMLGDIDLLD